MTQLIRWLDEPNTLGSILTIPAQDFAYIKDVYYKMPGGQLSAGPTKSGSSFKNVAAIRDFLLKSWPSGAASAQANVTLYHKDPEEPLNYQKMHKSYWHIEVAPNGSFTTGEGFITSVETQTKVTKTTTSPAPKPSTPRFTRWTGPAQRPRPTAPMLTANFQTVGAITEGSAADSAAWGAYFKALRSNVIDSWQGALTAYKTLKYVREQLELPFIEEPPGGEQTQTPEQQAAWSPTLEQYAVNFQKMVQIIVGACDDVIAGKRKVAHDQTHGFGIELLPTDELRVGMDTNMPVLLSKNSDVVNVQGTVGVPWVPVLVAGVITTGIIAYAVVKAVDALKVVAEEKTMQTIALRDADLVKSGKATPEQTAAMTKALLAGAKELQKAKAEAASGPKPKEWTPLVKTVVWGGVAIAGLVIVAKLLPSGGINLGSSRTANPLAGGGRQENPTRRKVGSIGDVNPIEYGGGYVYKNEYGYFVEYTHGEESECPDVEKHSACTLTLYSVPVPDDVFADHNWVKVEDVARAVGANPEELRKAGNSDNVMERVWALEDIASYWGWHELDNYPQTVKASELKQRWRVRGGRKSNPSTRGEADTVASRELVQYVWNESDLSPIGPSGRGRSIMINLLRKVGRGTYSSVRAPRAWKYIVDDAAKRYAREFGGGKFSNATRWAAAEEISRDVETRIRAGDFDLLMLEAGYARFDLTHDEAEALRTWIAPRYRSGEILWDAWDDQFGTISVSAARRAFRATKGDGGNLGTVPLAGGGLARKIDKLWDAIALTV